MLSSNIEYDNSGMVRPEHDTLVNACREQLSSRQIFKATCDLSHVLSLVQSIATNLVAEIIEQVNTP